MKCIHLPINGKRLFLFFAEVVSTKSNTHKISGKLAYLLFSQCFFFFFLENVWNVIPLFWEYLKLLHPRTIQQGITEINWNHTTLDKEVNEH